MTPETQEEEVNHGLLGLGRWSILINNGYWKPRNFDLIIIELLQYAIQGRISRILLSVPPRHGKSTLISKNFVSYFLAHFPNEKVILTSYSQGLASEFGGAVKNILNHYGYLSPYKVQLATDSKAKHKFKLNKPYRGEMLASGAGGSILGFGAGLFVIDDPLKNVAEAESEVIQNRLRDWFAGTAKTRLERRTNGLPPIMINIAQRLHLKDLHGIIKETEPYIPAKEALTICRNGGSIDQNTWVDLNLPAICEDPEKDLLGRQTGQVLWEAQRSHEWLMAEKKSIGSYLFNALYQGTPQERDGEIFKREWFEDPLTRKLTCVISKKEVPEDLPTLRYWDFAATENKGDSTAGLLTSYDGEYLYILDLIHGQFSAQKVLRTFKRAAIKDPKGTFIKIEEEPGSGSKLLIHKFRADFSHDKSLKGINIRADKVRVSKKIRAFDLEGLAEDRKIKLVKAHWNQKLVDQLVSFRGDDKKHDDIVDTVTGSARHWLRPRRKVNI